MKFFNKLSVISLIVLMFSFMNIAQAATCSGYAVSSCDASKTPSSCQNSYRTASPRLQCAWDGTVCRARGAACTGGSTTSGATGAPCRTDADCKTAAPSCSISDGTDQGTCLAPCPDCQGY